MALGKTSWDRSGYPTSATTVWACTSWFCRKRGPFWVSSRQEAEAGARNHRTRMFLGLWAHQPVVCPTHGLSFTDFLHKAGLHKAAA